MSAPKDATPTRDFLLRDLPVDLSDKLKVAASLHRKSKKDYIRDVLAEHVKELEWKGIKLTLGAKAKG